MTDDTRSEFGALERHKLNSETARIAWVELQRFFAAGNLVLVERDLDLVEVAYQLSRDNKTQTERWIASGGIARVTDEQALAFHETQAELWAVVVKPWVLIQTIE